MSGISKAKRFRILARDGFRCAYCGASAPDVQLCVDHVLARADDGGNGDDNLTTACFDCNAGKSDRRLTGAAGLPAGVKERLSKRKERLGDPRNRSRHLVRKGNPMHHVLNTGALLEVAGQRYGNLQAALVWCESHRTYEWHFVPHRLVGCGATWEAFGPVPPPGGRIA